METPLDRTEKVVICGRTELDAWPATAGQAISRLRCLLLSGLLLLPACGEHPESAQRPHLILIVSDDHGYPDFGFMGSPYVQTPHLDRLASEGTVFRNGYTTASVCRPALRSLLTGLHPYQWNIKVAELHRRGVRRSWFEQIQDFVTLPEVLGEHGYASFQGGKLWEASHQIAGFTHGMQKLGDDTARGGVGIVIGRVTMKPVFDFLDAYADQPFFLWLAPRMPHLPHDAPEKHRRLYEGSDLSPAAIAYYANITRFDDVVGQLLDRLHTKGLHERSLVVFVADNGWDQGPKRPAGPLYAGPRGKKSMYDLGFHSPIVVSWPGHVPMGVVRDELVSIVDLFSTFLDYAGAPPRRDRPGHSLRPLLEGRGKWPREVVIGGMSELRRTQKQQHPSVPFSPEIAFFLRDERWRYIWNLDLGTDELYDIKRDPREERDLAADHPALVAGFRRRILAWQREMRRSVVLE